ncbi:Metallo-hydrolase/oxidoreductase [Fomitiporia mediterranea MF3/22]|uniref:Metallo-hydrolase/oxidoreductase n=1 Tax=Fomitiporia mediterranea (strain MF3/22) TaxID=694068 RepID=UPI0004408859|nr:Metallo-hydrolase/oxidoreductase [Fomitiporia mediterranea MF3/22]EJD06169.1 Metallo-hydrolase/oxidoreductase [Fomitiporia mediterranea MF3/22]
MTSRHHSSRSCTRSPDFEAGISIKVMSRPPHHANATRTLFQNPWKTPEEPDDNAIEPVEIDSHPQSLTQEPSWFGSLTSGLPSVSSLLSNIPLERARDLSSHGISLTKVVKPDFDKFSNSRKSVKATWLGHASFLVELPPQDDSTKPIRVLFDPMFSDRAGPSQWTGIQRRLPPPCTIAELPEFQFVLISHNHYDHLDLPSIHEIVRTRGDSVTFLVPLGNKQWLVSTGIVSSRIFELDWWDDITLPRPHSTLNSDRASEPVVSASNLTFVCVPAQHTSEIGQRYGPFDLSLLPIWRGGTLSFISQLGLRLTHHPLLSAMHTSPSDAISIHRDVRSRHSLAMHFGTFAGSETEALEPLVELALALQKAELGDWWQEGGIGAIDVGETVEVRCGSENEESRSGQDDDGAPITR